MRRVVAATVAVVLGAALIGCSSTPGEPQPRPLPLPDELSGLPSRQPFPSWTTQAPTRAAKDAGADVVIASLHWGNEYESTPTATQRSMARTLLADPAVDLIVGHHAQVVQPFESVDGK